MMWSCEFEKGLAYLEGSLKISLAARDHPGIITAKTGVALCHAFRGAASLAYETSSESLRMIGDADNPTTNLVAFFTHGVTSYFCGLWDEAERSLRTGMEWYAKAAQNIYGFVNCAFLGDLYCDLGKTEEARQLYEQGITELETTGLLPSWLCILNISMTRAKALAGHRDISLGGLSRHYHGNKFKLLQGSAARNIAVILLTIGDHPVVEVETWLTKAIAVDQENAAQWYLAQDFALYAELCKRKGDLVSARNHLTRAIAIFKECGALALKEKMEQELADLS